MATLFALAYLGPPTVVWRVENDFEIVTAVGLSDPPFVACLA